MRSVNCETENGFPNGRLTEMNKPALESRRGCLSTIAYAELAEDIVDVTFDCCFADVQAPTDFLIALSLNDEFEYFHLPGG